MSKKQRKMKNLPLTPVVAQIGRMHFEGNITPMSWYKHITRPGRRTQQTPDPRPIPEPIAIDMLSDIIYWYRPVEIRSETTGEVIGYRRKFQEDMLQRSTRYYVNLFGYSKTQVNDAFDLLEEIGLIRQELRTIKMPDGTMLANVRYVAPIPEMVAKITYADYDNPLPESEDDDPNIPDNSGGSSQQNTPYHLQNRGVSSVDDTNTKTTNTESINKTSFADRENPASFVAFDEQNQPESLVIGNVRTVVRNGKARTFIDMGNPETKMNSRPMWQAELNRQCPITERLPLVEKIIDLSGLRAMFNAGADDENLLKEIHYAAVAAYGMGIKRPEQLDEMNRVYWKKVDWRGKKGQTLSVRVISEVVSAWLAYKAEPHTQEPEQARGTRNQYGRKPRYQLSPEEREKSKRDAERRRAALQREAEEDRKRYEALSPEEREALRREQEANDIPF